MEIATAPWQVDGLREQYEQAQAAGVSGTWLDGEELRAEIHSPTYLAGHWHHDSAILDPARLAWGLARACEERGVRIFEGTPVTSLGRVPGGVGLVAPWGVARAHHVVLATNAFRPLLRRLRLHIVPVYDYALMTEPLTLRSSSPSAGRAGRRWRTPATCSTTTGSPRTSASCGAAGTRCTTAAGASAGSTRTGPTCSPNWPVTSSPRSRSSRG